MSTPCILARGTPTSWKGVPCKMEGNEASTGPVVIDRIVRAHGVAAAAEALVDGAPFGWSSAGGERLTEVDDFLVGKGLSESTEHATLANHYALYLLDTEARSLRVKILPDNRWLDPVSFDEDGAVTELPSWYPKPPENAKLERVPMPPELKTALQAFCDKHRIRKTVLFEALRDWCLALLGDLGGCTWLLNDGSPEAALVGGRVGDVTIYLAKDAYGNTLKGSDGRLRELDVDNVRLAGKMFGELAKQPRYSGPTSGIGVPQAGHASEAIKLLLTAAFALASGVPSARVDRFADRFCFLLQGDDGIYASVVPRPQGWLPPFVSWVLSG